MIFLAICPPDSSEVHVKWEGHKTVEDAVGEIDTHRANLIRQGKMPYDCYVYEAEIPPYGNKAYELDDVDMNFYESRDKNELDEALLAVQQKLDEAIKEVGIKAGIIDG